MYASIRKPQLNRIFNVTETNVEIQLIWWKCFWSQSPKISHMSDIEMNFCDNYFQPHDLAIASDILLLFCLFESNYTFFKVIVKNFNNRMEWTCAHKFQFGKNEKKKTLSLSTIMNLKFNSWNWIANKINNCSTLFESGAKIIFHIWENLSGCHNKIT